MNEEKKPVVIGRMKSGKFRYHIEDERENPNQGRVYRKEGICPCLNAMRGGNRQPFIIVEVEDGEDYCGHERQI